MNCHLLSRVEFHKLSKIFFFFTSLLFLTSCGYKEVELRQIKNVVADVTDHPMLKAEAIFYNPNKQQGKLKAIHIDVYVEGKKAALIDQRLKIKVPAKGEFTVPLEVKLNMKEQGLFNTLLNVIGAKKLKVRYKGHVTVNYHGIPVRVAVDHEEYVRLKL